jgi:hypothetical protein
MKNIMISSMINKSFLPALLVTFFLGCNAQQTQKREVSTFDKIQASGAVNVIYTQSDTLSLSLKGREKDLDKVETKVEEGVLIISNKGSIAGNVEVFVNNNRLTGIDATGACDVRSTNVIKTPSLNVRGSGASNINLKVEVPSINCVLSGASNVDLKGASDELDAVVSGASTLKAYKLTTKNTKVSTSGAATAKVFATDKLKASATGASDIRIKGDPKELSAEASSAANINRIKDGEKMGATDSGSDTTTYNLNKRKIMVINGKEKDDDDHHSAEAFKHWRGFSMAVNGYLANGGNFNMPAQNRFMDLNYSRSLNFQFNIIERHFNLVDNYLKVVTGFGFDYHLYELANRTNLNADTNYTWGSIETPGGVNYVKNKLRCTYLQVPLLIEINTSENPKKTFHIAFGVIGQYLIASRTKQVLEEHNDQYTKVRKDNYNLSPFAAKAHVNLGYKNFTVFAEYGLTQLFQPGKGPELYPFAAGIRLVPFG